MSMNKVWVFGFFFIKMGKKVLFVRIWDNMGQGRSAFVHLTRDAQATKKRRSAEPAPPAAGEWGV